MLKSIADGVKRYKTELRAYKAWTNGRKKVYGEKSSPLADWGGGDWQRVTSWNAELQAMEKALGLTKREIKKIEIECGIVQKKAKQA